MTDSWPHINLIDFHFRDLEMTPYIKGSGNPIIFVYFCFSSYIFGDCGPDRLKVTKMEIAHGVQNLALLTKIFVIAPII